MSKIDRNIKHVPKLYYNIEKTQEKEVETIFNGHTLEIEVKFTTLKIFDIENNSNSFAAS